MGISLRQDTSHRGCVAKIWPTEYVNMELCQVYIELFTYSLDFSSFLYVPVKK
jgi:hypothetical protein